MGLTQRGGRWHIARRGGVALGTLALVTALLASLGTSPASGSTLVTITRSPSSGPPTSSIAVSGSGFTAGEQVEIYFDTADMESATADASGSFSGAYLWVPTSAVPGTHWITAVGQQSGAAAQASYTVKANWFSYGSGPGRTGQAPYENVLDPMNVSPLAVAWTGTTAAGSLTSAPVDSSPAVAKYTFVGSSNGAVYAFDRAGCATPPCQPVWTQTISQGPVVSSPAATAGGDVYVGTAEGYLYALDPTNGSVVWRLPSSGSGIGAIDTSPAIDANAVFVASNDGYVYAATTAGAPLWRALTTSGAQLASPALGYGYVFVGSSNGTLYVFNEKTGKRLAAIATGGPITTAPAVADGVVYVGSSDGTLSAYSVKTGAPVFTASTGSPITGGPAVAFSDVYVGTASGVLYAFPTECSGTCQPQWTGTTGGEIASHPAAADGIIFLGSNDGSVYAFNGRSGALLWSYATGGSVQSSPAVVDGTVYVGSGDGNLYAFALPQAPAPPPRPNPSTLVPDSTPIRHVVIVYQENHSFDDVFGYLCVNVLQGRCEGATSGQTADGQTIPLAQAPDVVPQEGHAVKDQTTAIDGGKMDGFSLIKSCTATNNYSCYQQYQPSQIPSLTALAENFVISDHTFEQGAVPSWGAHLGLAAAQFDGFTGDNPQKPTTEPLGYGWGCDSDMLAAWRATPGSSVQMVPSCVPRPDGSGPITPSPVQHVPTIMDRLDSAGLSWRLYTGDSHSGRLGYGWAICPTFADCIYGPQENNNVNSSQVMADAAAGKLPNFSVVTPVPSNSQHNGYSMMQGDNWISQVVSSIENSPEWGSTAIFITYDDCGCFYDHVAPPAGMGIRVPMVIVSPYAKPAFTDAGVASYASMLAYLEHAFGVPPLSPADSTAYDYSNSFDYTQAPLRPVPLTTHAVPPASLRWIRNHPNAGRGDT